MTMVTVTSTAVCDPHTAFGAPAPSRAIWAAQAEVSPPRGARVQMPTEGDNQMP